MASAAVIVAAIDRFSGLPDELLEHIVIYLPPADTLAFGATCKRHKQIVSEPLVWRRLCIQEWEHWDACHELADKLQRPPAETKWRHVYQERQKTDSLALELFNALLETQQHRIERMEKIAKFGYDVKDLMLKQSRETPDDAEDVLARRYYANAILGQIHRKTALQKWVRLQERQAVKLEEVLGAYDLFVLAGSKGDLDDIAHELDRIADRIRARDPEFDERSVRTKAVQIAKYLRSENLVGNPSEDDYHALRNNFISIALFEEPHTSLPLQSVAIYCAVASRLGVNAAPSNYPSHVHAVIEVDADAATDLDGKPRSTRNVRPEAPSDVMHMDPWRSSTEVPRSELTTRLSEMGAPVNQHNNFLHATTILELALRTGRNIMNSVQMARDRQRGTSRRPASPDIESAWYSMLWAMFTLSDGSQAAVMHRRRQCLPYLLEHYQAHFPEDLMFIEDIIAPMFAGEREHHILIQSITASRSADANRPSPSHRPKATGIRAAMMPIEAEGGVAYRIGMHFQHQRYGYEGAIIGWDIKCGAEQRWIDQMGVDDLPRGRLQPFYNVVADDNTVRYVAEENITPSRKLPSESLLALAGRYFKRYDTELGRFVSNMKDEYPDD